MVTHSFETLMNFHNVLIELSKILMEICETFVKAIQPKASPSGRKLLKKCCKINC